MSDLQFEVDEGVATLTMSRPAARNALSDSMRVEFARIVPQLAADKTIRAVILTGEGGTAQAEPDRTITFDAVDFTYEDLDLTDITAGTTIRFEMTNTGDQPHEFEVLDPGGEAIGEVGATDPGETGGATMTFAAPGKYTYQCILIDPATGKKHSMLGMAGTFSVAPA